MSFHLLIGYLILWAAVCVRDRQSISLLSLRITGIRHYHEGANQTLRLTGKGEREQQCAPNDLESVWENNNMNNSIQQERGRKFSISTTLNSEWVRYRFTFCDMKRSRITISVDKKREIVKFAKLNPSFSQQALGDKFSAPRSTIRDILKDSKKILQEDLSEVNLGRTRIQGGKNEELEKRLFQWFCQKRSQNIIITDNILRTKGQAIGEELEIENFKYSQGWLNRFKKRHLIKQYTLSGEAANVDRTSVENEIKKIKEKIKSYELSSVYNCDETALFYRMIPDKSLSTKSESHHGVKRAKDRITILLCCNSTGTDKRKLFIIGKAKKPRSFKNFNASLYCTYTSNSKAWMTGSIFLEYSRDLNVHCAAENKKILLLLDNATSHRCPDLSHVELLFLPPNMTSSLQPLDSGIIKNFKSFYRQSQLNRYVEMADDNLTPDISLKEAIIFSKIAWDSVSETTIRNCWRHTGLLSLTEGEDSEGDAGPQPVLRENVFDRMKSIFNITDILSQEEFCDFDQTTETEGNEKEERVISSEDEENCASDVAETDKTPVTSKQACASLSTVIEFFENHPLASEDDIKTLMQVRRRLVL